MLAASIFVITKRAALPGRDGGYATGSVTLFSPVLSVYHNLSIRFTQSSLKTGVLQYVHLIKGRVRLDRRQPSIWVGGFFLKRPVILVKEL
jgi:hypothetical protein